MKHVVLDLAIDPDAVERLRRLPNVIVHQLDVSHAAQLRPAELLRQTHVLICKHPPRNFDDLTVIELIQFVTVGFEHHAHLNLGDRPFTVCNARGIFDTGIGEWNIAMMINLTRDLRGMIRRQERGAWERSPAFQEEIRGKTIGLWGYGGLARETARLAKTFGMTIHAMTRAGVKPRHDDFTPAGTGDPKGKLPDREFLHGQELEFLSSLDFLILALPRTRATTGLIGEAELHALPRTACLLNPARGPIVQEHALLRALREGWIAGAALDTHHYYPMPPDHPLWQFPNVIMTPHVSGGDKCAQFPARIGELCVENVSRLLAGRPLLNVVSKDDLRASNVPQQFW